MKWLQRAVAVGTAVAFLVGSGCGGEELSSPEGPSGIACTPGEQICGETEFSGIPAVLECIIVEGETQHKDWSVVDQCGEDQVCVGKTDQPVCMDCSCQAKACGDDGCGNSCGECPVGGFCEEGQCLPCVGADCPPGQACSGGDIDDCTMANGDSGVTRCVAGFWGECSLTLCKTPGDNAVCLTSCGSSGVRTCGPDNQWGTCTAAEVCDGDDNDCDGTVDNGVEGLGVPCGNEDLTNPTEGGCEQGSLSCEAGKFTCPGKVEPIAEICDGQDNDCDSVVDEGMSADEYEENDSCSMARDLGQIEENAGEMSIAATIYKDQANDYDWWKVSTKELGDWWPCGLSPIPYVSDEPCLVFDLGVMPPSGLDMSVCVYGGDCDGDGGSQIYCSDNPTAPFLLLGWHNKWGPGANMDLYVEVKAQDPTKQSCVPYTMVYSLYDVGCPVDGKCPWEEGY